MSKEIIIYLATSLLTIIPVGLILAFIPYYTRKTENFGVSIPSSMYERKDFNSMRKKYTSQMILLLIITIMLIFGSIFFMKETMLWIVSTIIIFAYILAGFLLYLPYHFKMKKIKLTENWLAQRKETVIVDMKFRDEKITISYNWYIIPFIIMVLTTIIPFIKFEQIPDQLPIHLDFSGNITYVTKSISYLLMLPGIQLFMIILFLAINYIIKHAKQQIDAENPEQSNIQNTIYRRKWSIFTFFISLLTIVLLTYFQISLIYQSLLKYDFIIILLFTAIILISSIALSIHTGQGGSRIKIASKTDDSVINRDEDRFWKLGQFYVNSNDPAIFVEKRFGIGWTNNWAHPGSWIALIILLVVLVIPLFFI